MDRHPLDQCARSLARGGSRRWALKALAAGAVGAGLVTHGARSSVAKGRSNNFAKCMEGCLALCERQHTCRITERDCAASCSNAEL